MKLLLIFKTEINLINRQPDEQTCIQYLLCASRSLGPRGDRRMHKASQSLIRAHCTTLTIFIDV